MSGATEGKGSSPLSWIKLPLFYCWTSTAWNAWGVEVEQQYSDGRFRHRTFDDWMRTTEWRAGPHPIAQKLRDEGKDETDLYRHHKRRNEGT